MLPGAGHRETWWGVRWPCCCRLGKTFQSIVTMWMLLTNGIFGQPTCTRVLILTPSSLVTNWGREVDKWLGRRLRPTVLDDSKGEVVKVGWVAGWGSELCGWVWVRWAVLASARQVAAALALVLPSCLHATCTA